MNEHNEVKPAHSTGGHPVPGLHGEHVMELAPGFPILRLDEASLDGLTRLMSLEDDIFGDDAVGEWYMVSHINHGNVMVLMDAAQKRSVGIAILMRDWDELDKCYLADFGIREGYRGRGFGSSFLNVVLGVVKEEGFKRVRLTVDIHNSVAIRLYEKHGFRIVHERRNHYGLGRDRYIMELEVLFGKGQPQDSKG